MADDQSLKVTITADTGDAQANMLDVVGVLGRIEAALKAQTDSAAAAGTTMAEGQARASGAAKEHAASETILGEAIGKVEVATNSAARAFGALGLQTGEATERVLVFTEALDALDGAAAPLLVIGAAFLAIGAAVNFVSEGIQDAAREQSEFVSMQSDIKNAGGNWDEAKESIERFATALSEATIYSKGEAIAALDSLTSAGISLSDSEKIVAVSTDIAAAKHRSLQDVVDTLKAAEAGRGRGLEELDVKTRTLVESHAKLSTIIEALAKEYSGDAAAATDTYAGKQARLRNEIELFSTEVGTMMLPMLSNVTQFFIGMTKSAEDGAASIAKLGKVLADLGTAAKDMFDPAKSVGDMKTLLGDWGSMQSLSDKSMDEAFHPMNTGAPDMATWRKMQAAVMATPWDNDPSMGRKGPGRKAKATGDAYTAPALDDSDNLDKKSTDALTESETNLESALKRLTGQQQQYKDAVTDAWNEQMKQTAEMAEAKNSVADAQHAITLINAENVKLADGVRAETGEEKSHSEAVVSTKSAYDTYAKALTDAGKASTTQRAALENLKKEHEDAQKAYNASVESIKTLNGEIEKNNGLLDEQSKHLNDVNALLAKQREAMNSAFVKEFGDSLLAAAEAQKKLNDATQNATDEEATYKKSIEQQIAYFQQRQAALDTADGNYAEESAKLAEKIQSLEVDEYKQRVDAHEAFVKEFTAGEDSMLDDVLTKHESFSDRMQSIWKSLLDDWIKLLEQMVEKSSLLSGINSEFFKIFGGGSSGGGIATAGGIAGGSGTGSGGGLGGVLQNLIGSGGSQQQGVPTQLTDDTVQKLTGSTTGLDDGFNGTTVYGGVGTYSDGGADGTQSSIGDVFGSGFTSGIGSNALKAALSGVSLGALAAGIDGGNSTYGSLLGGAGSIVGSIFGGPVGSEIGGVAGGLLGSMFGPHWGPASNYPDRSDTQRFGQTVADLQGTMGANGQSFYEDQGTLSAFGGKTGIAGVEELLASGNAAQIEAETGLNPTQYAAAMADFGASASGSGKLNFGTHIGTEWVTGATGSGTQFNYADAGALLSQIESGLGGSGSQAIPTFDVTRTYGNPNLAKLSSTGTYLDSSTSGTNLLPTVAANSTAATNPTVEVTINGNVVGPGGLDQVAVAIGQSLQRVNNGLVTGSSILTGRTRVGQN